MNIYNFIFLVKSNEVLIDIKFFPKDYRLLFFCTRRKHAPWRRHDHINRFGQWDVSRIIEEPGRSLLFPSSTQQRLSLWRKVTQEAPFPSMWWTIGINKNKPFFFKPLIFVTTVDSGLFWLYQSLYLPLCCFLPLLFSSSFFPPTCFQSIS